MNKAACKIESNQKEKRFFLILKFWINLQKVLNKYLSFAIKKFLQKNFSLYL